MKIGLIDVDGHNFPNLPLMKLSAWHKAQGDSVQWYSPLLSGHMDRVYMSKVFNYTPDYEYHIDADEVIKGGTGYEIVVENDKEKYIGGGTNLPNEIEHIYPDYSLYGITDTAYGFCTRGCPRGCSFCIVAKKEGRKSIKVADLSEFWDGQKNIKLLDPNITACKDFPELARQFIDSRAYIDFSQGIDIRTMTEDKAELFKQMKIKAIHFAWDNYSDREIIIPKLQMFKKITGWNKTKVSVYVLTNFNTSFEQDLERVYTIREIGFHPDVRIYQKHTLPKGHDILKLQRWCNAPWIFYSTNSFEEYRR